MSNKLPHLKENSPPYHLLRHLKRFHKGGPLLLALSGGGDSLSLFHSLLILKEPLNLNVSLLHVNHGLREESLEEEKLLAIEAERRGIPLYIHRISNLNGGNLEETAREKRLLFFQEMFSSLGAEALLMGHHGDDQAETVLKRFFEGAFLTSWRGMKEVSPLKDMVIWRPLLKLRKKQILFWLQEIGVVPFEDVTNLVGTNSRAKMRRDILPFLSQSFGKEIVPPILALEEEVGELTDLLDHLVEPFLNGSFIPPTLPRLAQKHLLRKRAQKEGVPINRPILNQILSSLSDSSTKQIIQKEGTWLVRRYEVEFQNKFGNRDQ